ncbi:transposase [Streptomyces aureoversilis]|uniref:Mutator family transposase n=1 Tax=Streptomyces aureoversilis TaxID=67277 RepID=A0ABW0ABK1_9ACTN
MASASLAYSAHTEFIRLSRAAGKPHKTAGKRQEHPLTGSMARIHPYLAFPPEIRKVVYSTNLIESINARLRKVTRNRGHFPSEQAALKALYLAVREQVAQSVRCQPRRGTHWKKALNQFSLFFEGRLNTK